MEDTMMPVGDQHEGDCCERCQDETDYHYLDWVLICCCRSLAPSDDRDDVLDAIRTTKLRRRRRG